MSKGKTKSRAERDDISSESTDKERSTNVNGNTNGAEKLALLIGINQHAHLPDIRGCVNDVKLMHNVLQEGFGFSPEGIKLLLDDQASRARILEGMDWLLEQADKGDVVVMHFSGHGAQVPDATGTRSSGMVSTIVPYDAGLRTAEGEDLITYNEIRDWLLKMTQITPNVTLTFDCDHAGTISSGLDGKPLDKTRYVFIGGCCEDEYAIEYPVQDLYHGVFTYALVQELLEAESGASYKDVFERVTTTVMARFERQHPQIEGDIDRPLFAVGKRKSMLFIPVVDRMGHEIQLAAGAAHGMTAGSQWAIYPVEIDIATSQTLTLGLVEIKSVGATESKAVILSESHAEAVAAGTMAVEQYHNYGEMRLIVDVQVPEGFESATKELETSLEGSELLRAAGSQERASVTVRIVPPRVEVGRDDPVPQLGAIDRPKWAVVDGAGNLALPTHPADPYKMPWELYENLERLASYWNVLNLRNPNINSPLQKKVDLILLRQTPDGNWVTAKPEAQSGTVVVTEGERIAFRIVNRYSAPVYVSVLDFGVTGTISLLHPLWGPREALQAGEAIEVGVREGDELELFLPDDFPFVPDASSAKARAGVETLKLFATTYETDFASLVQQDGYRSVEQSMGETTMLWQLLDMALTGWGSRESRKVNLPTDQDWTTVERTFMLQRGEGGPAWP
jgi:hypothetical protein